MTSLLYKAMENVFGASHSMRCKYLVPDDARRHRRGISTSERHGGIWRAVFRDGEPRRHGNDERISIKNLHDGTELLLKLVLAVTASDGLKACHHSK